MRSVGSSAARAHPARRRFPGHSRALEDHSLGIVAGSALPLVQTSIIWTGAVAGRAEQSDRRPIPTVSAPHHSLATVPLVVGLLAAFSMHSALAQEAEEDGLARDYAAELPRVTPLEAEEALEQFTLLRGFRIELVAAEPLVVDPIALAFDADGGLFVVEMRGYSERRDDNAGTIRRLADGDGDGTFEQSTVFADGLSWPTAIACYGGGIFVGAAPDILYLEDTNGDGRADRREVVFTGFGTGNVQGLLNSFRWGLDSRIHGATSNSGGSVRPASDPRATPLALRGRDFSFDPRAGTIRAESGGGQHGACFDDWGRRFVCSNSDHAQQVLFTDGDVARNPFLRAPSARVSIAADGAQADVFRTSPVEPWRRVRTRLRVKGLIPGPVERGGQAAGYFTSATGITIYRGDAWPAEYIGQLFVGDVGGNLLHRKVLRRNGLVFAATRATAGREFLTSSDPWFRPVQCANGPDGNLYIADMYREVIEHPHSLAPLIKKHLDLTSGDDRGRIYRVVHADGDRRPVPRLSTASTRRLVALLAHPNAWHRETAARLLHERADSSARASLALVARTAGDARGRLHALHALAGIGGLTPALLLDAMRDEDARVRAHAVRLAAPLADRSVDLRDRLLAMVDDPDLGTRYELAFALGDLTDAARLPALAALARTDGGERWMRLAIASSVALGADALLALLEESGANESPASLIAELSHLALASGTGPRSADSLRELLATAHARATDPSLAPGARADSIRALALDEPREALETLCPLVDPRAPLEVQLAAIQTLARIDLPATGTHLLDALGSLGPTARLESLAALFSREAWVHALLDALAAGSVRLEWLDASHARFLRSHESETVRERAGALLARAPSSERSAVLARFQPALALDGDPVRGEAFFTAKCATCHRHRGAGVDVGPELATALHRGAAAILADVIDPNREVDPRYQDYMVRTIDGRSVTGIIVAESAATVTLARTGGVTDIILRHEIDEIRSSGLSLMPEGLETDLDQQAVADLLAFILEER